MAILIDEKEKEKEKKKSNIQISDRTRAIMAMAGMKPLNDNSNYQFQTSDGTREIMAKAGMKEPKSFINNDNTFSEQTDEERISQKMEAVWEKDNKEQDTTDSNTETLTQQSQNIDSKTNTQKLPEDITNKKISQSLPATVEQNPKSYRDIETKINVSTPMRIASNEEKNSKNSQRMTVGDVNAMKEAYELNKDIKQGGSKGFFASISVILNNITGGVKSAVGGIGNAITTLTAYPLKPLSKLAYLFKQDEIGNTINNWYNNVIEAGSYINEKGQHQSNVTARIDNGVVRTLGQTVSTGSEMLTNAAIGELTGVGGNIVQAIDVFGHSAQEVLDENPENIEKAIITANGKGMLSYLTEEMFDANILTRGTNKSSIEKQVTKVISNLFKTNVGKEIANTVVGIAGENIEEVVEDNCGYLIDALINQKDLPSFEEWLNNTNETAKITTLSTMLLQLLGLGGNSFRNKEITLKNDTDFWAYEAQKIIDKDGLALQYDVDKIITDMEKNTFYSVQYTKEGEVADITSTQGKQIDNPNKKVNVSPVIIKNSNTDIYNIATYNVIDGNTGVLIDSSPYTSLIQAQAEFNHKMINLNNATINNINSKVTEANIAIKKKTLDILSQVQNNTRDTANQYSQNQFTDNLNDKATNYTGQNIKTVTDENRTDEQYNNEISNSTSKTSNIKQYTQRDIDRFSTNKNNIIDKVNGNIESFVEEFYDYNTKKAKKKNNTPKNRKMFLGRISDNLAKKINNLLNTSKRFSTAYDTTDTNVVISSNNIEHIYNYHGNEKRAGQMDVTPEKLSKYGEVIFNPDYIGISDQLSRGDTPTLYFSKKINGYSVAVEVLSNKKQLYPESYYIFKSDSKEYQDFIKNNKLKKAEDVESNDIMSSDSNALGDTSVASIDTSIPQSDTKVKSSTNTNSMQNNQNNSQNDEKGGNENVEQERSRRSTYNGQKTNRMQEGENTRRESQDARSNELVKEKQSKGLSNYQKQQQEKLGKNFYATTVERNDQSKNEQIVSDGFKAATGLDMSVFTTNKSTSEGAFYSNDSIFVKHNSLANKKSTNFRPYHEFGHWLKNNKTEQWKKLYDIVDSSITKEQIRQYKNVLNNNSIFNNMTEGQTRDYIINEVISDYIGNWANDITNWQNYLSTISQEYQDFLVTMALEEEYVGYNIFGSLEQQNRMNEAITEIMRDVIGKDNSIYNNTINTNEIKYHTSRNLSADIDKVLTLTYEKSSNDIKLRDYTPNILVSAGIKNLPMLMNQSHIRENILSKTKAKKLGVYNKDANYHNLGKELFIKAIDSLDNPLIVMKSISKQGKSNSYVIVTDLQDKNGNQIIIPIYIETVGYYNNIEITTNKVKTVYGKSDIKQLVNNTIQGDINNIIYLTKDKNKRQLVTTIGLQLSNTSIATSNNNISQKNNSVKSSNIAINSKSMQNNQNNTNKIQKSDRNDLDNNSNQNYSKEQEEMQNKQREERRRIAKLIRERSFFTNVYNSDVSEEFRSELRKNRKDYQYEPINNEDTLAKANNKVENNKNIREEFLSKDLNSAEDTAVGEVLIRKALAVGDYEEANILTASLAEKLTKAGQTVQAAAIFKRMSPDGMTLFAQRKIEAINDELKKKYKLNQVFTKKLPPQIKLTDEKIQFINGMMKQMQELEKSKKDITDGFTMETIERQQDVILAKVIAKIGEGIPTTKLDKLAAWRNISLLLNSKTIMRNLISNTLFSTLENVSDILGVGIDKAISLVTGERSLLMPDLKTQLKGFKKGLSYAIEDTKEGISTSLGGNKYNIEPTKVFENKLLQKLETASYFGVEGLDRPYMQAKYESALQMIMKLEGLNYGKDIPTEAMKEEALEMANYTTFKDKNAISDLLSKVKKVLNGNKSIGLADVIGLTYTNIPGNLTKKALDYSPTGLYNVFKAYTDLKSKQLNGENIRTAQRQLVQATSRTLIGTGIMAVSIQAFLAGVLTASGDDEDDKVKELVGKENYAINVSGFLRWISGGNPTSQNGDLYVTYSNYEPLSSIMAAAAEMAGAAKEGDGVLTVAHKGITTWINTIAELSTLSNFSSLFEYKNLGGNLTRSISEFPASFIPTTCKQIAQLFEQNSKSNYSDSLISKYVTNPILQRIPGLSSILENNYDTFGNEAKSYNGSTGLGRLFNVFLNTSYTSTVNMDETAQELYDLYLSTGLTDHLPIEVSNYFTYKGQKITLTSEEKAQYQKELGQRTVEAFKEEMQTTEYKNMTDEEKVKALSRIISDLKTEVRGEVILEPRGLAYDATFTPSSSTLSKNGYKLTLTEEMRIEYEKLASDRYKQYEKQGIYSKEKLEDLKSKCKDYAKSQLMQKYRNQLVRNK